MSWWKKNVFVHKEFDVSILNKDDVHIGECERLFFVEKKEEKDREEYLL